MINITDFTRDFFSFFPRKNTGRCSNSVGQKEYIAQKVD